MNRVTRLYLIRHGQVNGFERFPVYGHTDVEMTETGLVQLQHAAERLRLVDVKAIYTSDLKRCLEGAKIIARHHDAPLCPLPELREMYFGEWEGLTLEELRDRYPRELESRQNDLVNYRCPGNGESLADLAHRVTECVARILEECAGRRIILVGHAGVNRVILCNALGLEIGRMFSIHQDYGCLNIVEYRGESGLVRMVNG